MVSAAVAIGVTSASAVAPPCAAFTAVAASDGARVGVSSPGFLVVEETHGGAPAAQAVVNSTGESTGYAAAPHPGDAALTAAHMATIPTEAYPLMAQSTFPNQEHSEVDAPPVSLTSTSSARATTAVAQSALSTDPGSSAATAAAAAEASCADDGTIRAAAESAAEGLSFANGVLRIGRVRTVATVVVGTDGQPQIESHFEVGQATIAGQTVQITEQGVEAAGSASPLPADPFADVLADAGVALSFVAGHTQPDGRGVTAPVLRVEVGRQLVGTGATTLTYTFGHAYAGAGVAPSLPAPPSVAAAPDSSNPGVAPTEPALTPGSAQPPPMTTTGARPAAPVVDLVAAPAAPIGRVGLAGFPSWSAYIVLIIAAVLLLTAAVLFRHAGVRYRWT